MGPTDLLQDYLIDQEIGLKELLTWFLNQVMLVEALQQTGAEPYQRIDGRKAHREKLIEMDIRKGL
jgi:putative transposase